MNKVFRRSRRENDAVFASVANESAISKARWTEDTDVLREYARRIRGIKTHKTPPASYSGASGM